MDVARGIRRNQGDVHLLERLRDLLGAMPGDDPDTEKIVIDSVGDLATTIEHWKHLEGPAAEAKLFPLAVYMADVWSAALLLAQSGAEKRLGWEPAGRKGLVARLYVKSHLAPTQPYRGIDDACEDIERFDELLAGAFVDPRS
jgi:hypothetical protein